MFCCAPMRDLSVFGLRLAQLLSTLTPKQRLADRQSKAVAVTWGFGPSFCDGDYGYLSSWCVSPSRGAGVTHVDEVCAE